MDYDRLLNEILNRVSDKLASLENVNHKIQCPKLLILTENHGTTCHDFLENAQLLNQYHIDCGQLMEYNCNVNEYEAVVIFHLSNNGLSKLAAGISDTPFTSLASQAILLGKKIFILEDEIELYQYKQTAPIAYYSMFYEKIKLLIASGITFCKKEELIKNIAMHQQSTETSTEQPIFYDNMKSSEITKKIITERDIKKLFEDGVTKIRINRDAILTDLAKEFIHNKKIEIEKEFPANRKQRNCL